MTLILTEVTKAGIAMATDSAISLVSPDGTISAAGQQQWPKLFKVPRICSGVSYWGHVGRITNRNFHLWLEERIASSSYNDLPSFADFLTDELNRSCRGSPLANDQCVGLHVAGYHEWQDGVRRPTFYHVHNGHGHIEWDQTIGPRNILVETRPRYAWAPRELFSRYNDYPISEQTLATNLLILEQGGYITSNGDYAPYILISQSLQQSCAILNTIPNVSIPRDPNSIASRLGYLKMILDTVIRIYGCSNLQRTIGGVVMTLGIRPDESFVN